MKEKLMELRSSWRIVSVNNDISSVWNDTEFFITGNKEVNSDGQLCYQIFIYKTGQPELNKELKDGNMSNLVQKIAYDIMGSLNLLELTPPSLPRVTL